MNKIRTFILTSPAFDGEVELVYIGGILAKFDSTGAAITEEQRHVMALKMALVVENVRNIYEHSKTAKLVEITKEITFDDFWKKYDNKISNKKRTENKWNSMPKGEQKKAYDFIQKYYNMLPNGVQPKYAETYLNSEIWNN